MGYAPPLARFISPLTFKAGKNADKLYGVRAKMSALVYSSDY
ncbi:hypothetical protein NSP_23750 [Nodularia spumigena CCY9414]|nr:hypothetical protein NSP_23750 [Nodularia spumigena CCY9414]